MTSEHRNIRARRVVAGVNVENASFFESDRSVSARVATEAFTINQIWQMDSLPPNVLTDDRTTGDVSIAPPVGGFNYLVTTFPPDSGWDPRAGYAEALAASGDVGAYVEEQAIAGLHQTDTVDIVTVVLGEIYAVLETGEVLLKPGDSMVQRGTKHAWSNRSGKPCTVVAVMVGASR